MLFNYISYAKKNLSKIQGYYQRNYDYYVKIRLNYLINTRLKTGKGIC